MAAELIGRCKCPLCGSDKARLSLAKSLLPVLTCNGCNVQLFTRSDVSDRLARGLLISEPQPAPKEDPAPPAAPPAAPASDLTIPAPSGFRPAWGFMGAKS